MRFHDHHHVPKIHADPVLGGDELQETTAIVALRQWKFSKAMLVVLAGDVGTGKSLAAAYALWDHLVTRTPVNPWGQKVAPDGRLWIAAPHLARLKSWSPEVAEVERAPILVLDDLGEERTSDESVELISSLLTTRMGNMLPTIVTTNLNGESFQARYGARIIDRIKQSGLDANGKAKWWVKCVGASLRGKVEPRPLERTEDDVVPEPESEPIDSVDQTQMANEFLRRIRGKSSVTAGDRKGGE